MSFIITPGATGPAGFNAMQVITSSGSFTIPSKSIKLTVIGAGGGSSANYGGPCGSSNGGNTTVASGTEIIATLTGNGGGGNSDVNGGGGGGASGGTLNIQGQSGFCVTGTSIAGSPSGVSMSHGGGATYGGGAYTYGPSGGAGGTAIKYLTNLTPGNTLTITIGAGGASGACGGAAGKNGAVIVEYSS